MCFPPLCASLTMPPRQDTGWFEHQRRGTAPSAGGIAVTKMNNAGSPRHVPSPSALCFSRKKDGDRTAVAAVGGDGDRMALVVAIAQRWWRWWRRRRQLTIAIFDAHRSI